MANDLSTARDQEALRINNAASEYASRTEFGEVIFPGQNWEMFVSALTSPVAPEQVVAAGWKLVPMEPTPEMIAAMSLVECTATCINRFADNTEEEVPILGMAGSEEAYAAMLAASPEAAPAAMEGDYPPLPDKDYLGDDVCWGYDAQSLRDYVDADRARRPAATPAAPSAVTDEQIATLKAQFGVTSNGRGIREFTQVKDFALAVAALAQPAPVQAGAQQAVAVTGEMIAAGMKAANVLDPVLATLYPNELTAVYQAMHAVRPFAHATECTTCGALVVGVAEPFDAEEARKRGIDYFADRYPALKEALAAPTQAGAGDAVDAQRYRWLREEAQYFPAGRAPAVVLCDEHDLMEKGRTPGDWGFISGKKLDAAIDAALKGASPTEGDAGAPAGGIGGA